MNAYEMVVDGFYREATIFADTEKQARAIFWNDVLDDWEKNCVGSFECVEIHNNVRGVQ